MKPGFYFDPEQITDDPNRFYRWAMKVKGTCVECGNPVYNGQDAIMLLDDENEDKVVAWFHDHDNNGKPCYWDYKRRYDDKDKKQKRGVRKKR